MTRYMYDATHDNALALLPLNPDMVAIYLTGTPDIRWLSADVMRLTGVHTWVRIDQGGATSPQYEATVFDVERGAWTLAAAQKALKRCTAPRPTLYVNRDTLPKVTAKCDIWLAAPGISDDEAIALARADPRIVAVQNVWNPLYDRSIVIDPYWPEKYPIVHPTPIVAQIEYYKPGFGWVYLTDPGKIRIPNSQRIRVRASNGTWSGWVEITPQ